MGIPTGSRLGSWHLEVAANAGDVSAIRLFSTGGLLTSATNQPAAVFTRNGATLGVGLHPFYAVVETSAGSVFRTQPQYARLLSGQ